MEDLTQEQLDKLKGIMDFAEKSDLSPNLPLVEELQAIRKVLEIIAEKEMPEMPKMEMPEVHKVTLDGIETITLKGDKGEPAEPPTDEHLKELIKPLIPPSIKPKDGYTPRKGVDYFDGEDGKSPSVQEIAEATSEKLTPLLPNKEEIISEILKKGDKIVESINSNETKIRREKIEGLDTELAEIRNLPRGGGISRGALRGAPFSFSGDGATTTFYLPTEPLGKSWFIFAHYQGQWLQKNVHYTVAGKVFNTAGGTSTFTAATGTVIEGFVIY